MLRIATKSKEFAPKFTKTKIEKKKTAILEAISYSITKADLHEPLILNAVEIIKNGTLPTPDLIGALEKMRDDYDNKYFDLCDEDKNTEAQEYFSKARAVSALVFALKAKSDEDNLESIYEAIMTDYNEEILEKIYQIIK